MILSETAEEGPLHDCRQQAIDGLKEISRRGREAGTDTVVILDTHRLVNAGYHINANAHYKGNYNSDEFPHFIQNLEYDFPGNPTLGDAIAAKATEKGVFTRDIYKAQEAWDELEVGGVVIGDVPSWRVDHMPYGGVKDSSLGREGIRYAIEDMTEIRLMVVRNPN